MDDADGSLTVWWRNLQNLGAYQNAATLMWNILPNETPPASDQEVSILTYPEPWEGMYVFNILNRCYLPNIIRARMLHTNPNNSVHVIFDGFPSMRVDTWIGNNNPWIEHWTCEQGGPFCVVSGTDDFIKNFRGIIAGLDKLFSSNLCHNNLLNGVLVSETNDAKLAFLRPYNDQFKAIMGDICNFGNLVSRASHNLPPPSGVDDSCCVHLFHDLMTCLPLCETLDELRVFWIFIKINPLFYGSVERYEYVKKLDEIKGLYPLFVQSILHQANPPSDMENWHRRLQHGTILYDVLTG